MITATGKQYGIGRANRDITGRLYSTLRWDRCDCRNAKPVEDPFCDRCRQLLDYRLRRFVA